MCTETSLNELALNYPGLLIERKTNQSEILINGVVKIKDAWYRLIMFCPKYPQLTDLQLHVLQNKIYEKYNLDAFKLHESSMICDLLQQLPIVVPPSRICAANSGTTKPSSNIYAEILQLEESRDCKIELNEQFTLLRCSRFVENEQHYVELELPTLRILEHSLPDCVPWAQLFEKSLLTLSSMLSLFQKYLFEMQPFYESFADIDELCHVLEPSLPTTKHNWRLFLLSERVYLKLTLADPFAPLSSMQLQIIGPTQDVEHLRHVYSKGLRSWDAELDIHKNLLRIFDLCYFPMPPVSDETDESSQQYCNICYSYRLDHGEVPLVSCDNTQCSLIFHAACLKEWFNTLSDGKTFLQVSFGACPFCKAKLSTSFTALLEH